MNRPKERTERQQNIIPTEDMYMPVNHLDYLKEDKYHHSEKGCEIKMIQTKYQRCWIVEKICLTHNKQCSKVGWENGYYNNTDSTKIFKLGEEHNCLMCNKLISSRSSYCKDCKKIRNIEIAKKSYEKKKMNRVIKEKRPLPVKKLKDSMRDGQISILMSYIKEYEKADYHDRIACKEYNEIVEKADELVSGFLKRKSDKKLSTSRLLTAI